MGPFFSGLSAVFSHLMDHTVEISVLICIIFLVKLIAGKKLPSWWHYSLWLMLVARMLLPLEFENRLNIYNFLPDITENQVFEYITERQPEEEIYTSEIVMETSSGESLWPFLVRKSFPVLWLSGMVLFGICILFESISFWFSVKRKDPVTDEEVLSLLAKCKERMKIQTDLDVVITDRVRSPALFGYIRPRLLLPDGILERLNSEELSYAFMHELGHLKRHDIAVSWLVAFLQIVHWFNPLVWIAFYHMRIDQESACDASVLSRIRRNQSADYAKAIVGFIEKFYQNCQLPSLAGIIENKSQMKKRLAKIVNYRRYSRKMTVAAVALFCFAAFVFFTFTGVAKEKTARGAVETGTENMYADIQSTGEELDLVGVTAGGAGLEAQPSEGVPYLGQSAVIEVAAVGETHEIMRTELKDVTAGEVDRQDEPVSSTLPPMNDKPVRIDQNMPPDYPAFFSRTDTSVDTGERSAEMKATPVSGDSAALTTPGRNQAGSYIEKQVTSHRLLKAWGKAEEGTSAPQASPVPHDAVAGFPGHLSGSVADGESAPEKAASIQPAVANTSALNSPAKNDESGVTAAVLRPAPGGVSGYGRGQAPRSAPDSGSAAGVRNEKTSNANTKVLVVKTTRNKETGKEPFLLSDVDVPPVAIRVFPPRYPLQAKRDNVTGYIKVQFVVTKEGNAIDTTIVESDPKGVFDQSVLDAIESYRFKPGIRDGEAVDVRVKLPIKYNLT